MKHIEPVDAVEMVRSIRDRQYEILKDRSPEERRQFYREQASRLHERLAQDQKRATNAGGKA